jgi:hypothetical protein
LSGNNGFSEKKRFKRMRAGCPISDHYVHPANLSPKLDKNLHSQ